jgi:hypothetical protein
MAKMDEKILQILCAEQKLPLLTQIMVPDELPSSETRFELLGKQLQEAMSTYVHHLKREKIPMPSFVPSSSKSHTLKSPEGIASQKQIVELAQQISAMTMDPATNLLVSSLQVRITIWYL